MAASKGRLFLLKKGSTPVTIGAAEVTATINNEQVPITNQGDAPDRALLANAGERTVTITANGIHKGEAGGIVAVRVDALSGAIDQYQVTNTESGEEFTWTGNFQVANYELTGTQNDALRFTLTLENDGPIVES